MDETNQFDETDEEEPEDLAQWTVARMAAWLSPRQAAKVKAMTALLNLIEAGAIMDEHTARINQVIRDDPGHRMFTYCLDAVARRA
jgi:hypothetical protein